MRSQFKLYISEGTKDGEKKEGAGKPTEVELSMKKVVPRQMDTSLTSGIPKPDENALDKIQPSAPSADQVIVSKSEEMEVDEQNSSAATLETPVPPSAGPSAIDKSNDEVKMDIASADGTNTGMPTTDIGSSIVNATNTIEDNQALAETQASL